MCIKVLKYHEDLISLDSILDLSKDHNIYKLGKIAFDCTQRQKMVFESSDLQGLGERFSDRVRGCGVLTARPVRADPKSKMVAIKSFYFIHLTIQEFIAAVYVSLLPAEKQREIWSKCLGEPHMAQVWRFYCGLTQLAQYELLQANITGYSKGFQMQCLFESQNALLVQKLMPHIVGEEVSVDPMTAYDSTAYGYCLSKHPTLKKLTINGEWVRASAGSPKFHRLLEPVCASGTLRTLCLAKLGETYSFWGAKGAPILFSDLGFCMASCSYIPYGRKFWRGIYFGRLTVLRAIRQYFICQKLHSVMSSLLRNHSLCVLGYS